MGGGSWTRANFCSYAASAGRRVRDDGSVDVSGLTASDLFKRARMADRLDPKGQIRECCETEEHPTTVPVILALDVTGSMGNAAMEVASKLSHIVEGVINEVKDAEFMIMGIGDLEYDRAPIQASQFESDTRTAENLDSLFFEGGGGNNLWESYTAAWYFGLHNTRLDCLKRGQRGVIITLGDEQINPFLPNEGLNEKLGCSEQALVKTSSLYEEASRMYDIYHVHVNHGNPSERREASARASFEAVIGQDHFKCCTIGELSDVIRDIIVKSAKGDSSSGVPVGFVDEPHESTAPEGSSGEIVW